VVETKAVKLAKAILQELAAEIEGECRKRNIPVEDVSLSVWQDGTWRVYYLDLRCGTCQADMKTLNHVYKELAVDPYA
jgi:hypothetical protein